MSKQRFNFVFDLENPGHARAYEILCAMPRRRQGEGIIQAILAANDAPCLRETVYEAVLDALANSIGTTQAIVETHPEAQQGIPDCDVDISDSVMEFLSNL